MMYWFLPYYISSNTQCEECKRKARGMISNYKFNSQTSFDKICKENKKCQELTLKLHRSLDQFITPKDYCQALELCRPKAQPLSIKPRATSNSITLHEIGDNCDFCLSYFEWLFGDGENDVTVPIFKEFLINTCKSEQLLYLICSRVKDRSVRIFINQLSAKFENMEFCRKLDLCQ